MGASTAAHDEGDTGLPEPAREAEKVPVHDGDEVAHTEGMVVNPDVALVPSVSPPSDGSVGRGCGDGGGGVGGAEEVGEGEAAPRVSEQYLLEAAGSMLGGVGSGDLEGDEVRGISVDRAVVCTRAVCCV